MKKTASFIIFLIALITTTTALAAAGTSDKLQEKLDQVVRQYQKVHQVPGIAVGVLKGNKIIYAKGFGVRNLETKEPVTTRSLFHMASVSKPFVATAIMQLVEKGKVKLEGKLVDYLPYFKMDDERYKTITIGQMLSHISGIPDVEDYEWDKPQYDDGAAERYIRSLTKEKLIAAPGEKFSYSNMAFDILADVIARASGMTFEAYMKENIFKPLQMNDSTFYKPEVPKELATTPHVISDRMNFIVSVSKIYPYNRAHAPSSTLHSNVMDMMNWGIANLNKGAYKNRRILQPATHELMWKPHVETGWKKYPPYKNVGLSWFVGKYKGHPIILHGGGDVGYRTFFLLLPGQSTAIVTLGNSATFRSREVAFAVLDVLLGEEPESPKLPISVSVARMLTKEGAKAAVELYHQLKKNKPDNYYFTEQELNRLGYTLVKQNRPDDAIEILKLNAAEYPKSRNVYDSLGEAYMKKGENQLAIKNYEKALQLNPQSNEFEKKEYARQTKVLNELKEKKGKEK
jgi:CubicO group peptidase (beta-lactamase class C family)